MSALPRTRPSTVVRPVFPVPSMVRNTTRSTRARFARSVRYVKLVLRRVAFGCLLQWRSCTVDIIAEGSGGIASHCSFSGWKDAAPGCGTRLPLTSRPRRKSLQATNQSNERLVVSEQEGVCGLILQRDH